MVAGGTLAGVVPDLGAFDRDGMVAIAGLLTEAEAAEAVALLAHEVDAARADPERAGHVTGGTVHLADVRDIGLPKVWEDPRVVAVLRHHLGDSPVATAVGYRAPRPGYGAQTLHVDWNGPVRPGQWQVANLIVALVPFTESNGATRVVPGSHRDQYQRFRAKSPSDRHPAERSLTGPAGTGFVFTGHLLHSGTANRSGAPRHALLINYRR
jgi:Phytanoyl-CoA dioxygenase (PhyH)